jgi:hypothetical protein
MVPCHDNGTNHRFEPCVAGDARGFDRLHCAGTSRHAAAAIGHRLYFGQAGISNSVLIILVALTLVSLLFDFLAGLLGARKFGATWRGATGALFFGLPGIIIGPFVGVTLLELLGGRELEKAAKAGMGATLGLFAGIIGKFSIAVVMILLFTTNFILRSAS